MQLQKYLKLIIINIYYNLDLNDDVIYFKNELIIIIIYLVLTKVKNKFKLLIINNDYNLKQIIIIIIINNCIFIN